MGALFTRFVACDIRRDIKIVDASEVDDGFVAVTSRTWNVLYAYKGIVPKPEFGEPERVAIEKLWEWKGPSWGSPVLEKEPKDKARQAARMVRGGPCQSRATSWRSMNKSELTAKANDVAQRRLEHWPAFDLFRLAERCFIECVEDLPEGSFDGEYYEILSGLRSTFLQVATVESAFANIFIDVWYCSNFTQSTWRGICAAKPEYAVLAVEHCYFVLAGSGADGSAQLTQLLDHFDAWNDVLRRLDQTPELHELREWVETLAPGASSSC